jgi:hypothetical protein
MTKGQLALMLSEPIWQPPCPPDEPAATGEPDAAAAPTPASDGSGVDGVVVEPLGPDERPSAPPRQISPENRSELGAMHTVVQPPSAARTGPSQFVSHPQVHVDGQSESTRHGVVSGAEQLLHETSVHVVPASQMEGIGKPAGMLASPSMLSGLGTALHGTVVTVA